MKIPALASKFLPWKSEKDEKEKERQLQALLRRVFCETTDGAIALSVLAEDFCYNRVAVTPEDVALRNCFTAFLQKRLGLTTDTLATLVAIINNQVHKEK